MNVYEVLKKFIDTILQPPISFLDLAIERLQGVQLVTAQGLNIGQYFKVFGDLPSEWQMVVTSLLASTVLLGTLLMVRSIMRLYFSVKDGVKWW
ncbi:hypothetical protein HMI01_25860 [Halolactibacillus miurensis]|uniref:Uncharacterized protein n=1 Tax=Halolactibacillus miurensis TaxID=306541 RepID=A0A1I6UU82_9BACI|nr:hypothetical protein [Halolactibacillus miurensis]GEM05598.1 hypothetical protein HMI01_25860 [Halolactibacillus miurensis]SFT04950.1 hypothetical protein SAMN05421668_13341 [Halolactibacillus miurensis]